MYKGGFLMVVKFSMIRTHSLIMPISFEFLRVAKFSKRMMK